MSPESSTVLSAEQAPVERVAGRDVWMSSEQRPVGVWMGAWFLPPSLQLEDLEVTVADHIQKVMKLNFEAAWDEVGDEFEKEETFTLSTIKTLEGKILGMPSVA